VPNSIDAYELWQINQIRITANLDPLAWHDALGDAAAAHSQWLIDNDVFEHSDPVADVSAAGFDWRSGSFGFFQNHQWTEWVPGSSDAEWQYVIDAHLDAYMNSPAHAENILNPNHEIAGVSNLMGEFQGWPQAEVNTQVFGWNEREDYIFGFVYNDKDNGTSGGINDYDIGEGLEGLPVWVHNVSTDQWFETATDTSGYYSFETGPGTFEVWFADATSADALVTTGSGNIEVDQANPDVNRPAGQTLVGTSGGDALYSTAGDDDMTGKRGNDTFYISDDPSPWIANGHDIIRDFDDRGNDVIVFDNSIFTDYSDVMDHATQVGAHVLIQTGMDNLVLDATTLGSLTPDDFLFV